MLRVPGGNRHARDRRGSFDVDHAIHLREPSYINIQSIQPVKFTEFVRKAPGQLDANVIGEVEAALKRWLRI